MYNRKQLIVYFMGLIIIWAGPVIGGQWWYAGSWIWASRKHWLLGIGIPTLYLWIADRVAIGLEIWSISEVYTLGPKLFGLPLEEATFFLVTNVLVVQGLIMVSGTLKFTYINGIGRRVRY